MKEIYLIRHGKVDIDNSKRIYVHEIKQWVDAYDTAPLDPNSIPTHNLHTLITHVDLVISSQKRRSIDSIKLLGRVTYESHSSFDEAKIPDSSIPFVKLKPKSWLSLLRILQMMGLGRTNSTLIASKKEAEKAVDFLITCLARHNTIAVVGHGGMNWLISKRLQKLGWNIEGKPMHHNWGVTKLRIKE